MLRKSFLLLLLFTLLFSVVPNVAANDSITVKINGKVQSYAQKPVIKNGATLVPLRGIFESLGATVSYDSKTKQIHASKGATKVQLELGKKEAVVNGKKIVLSVAAEVINGSTMVPLRFIGESLGAVVSWDGASKTITITNKVATYKSIKDYQGTWESKSERLDIHFVEDNLIRINYYYDNGKTSGPYLYDYAYAVVEDGEAVFYTYNAAVDDMILGNLTLSYDEVSLEMLRFGAGVETNILFTKHQKVALENTELAISEQDQTKIKEILEASITAYNKKDLKGYLSLVAPRSPQAVEYEDYDLADFNYDGEVAKLESFTFLFGNSDYVAVKVKEQYHNPEEVNPDPYTVTYVKGFIKINGQWKLSTSYDVRF